MAIELEMTDAGMMTEEELLEMSSEVAAELTSEEPVEDEGEGDNLDDTETVEDSATPSLVESLQKLGEIAGDSEWPDETITTTDASPDDDGADLLAQIANAERECKRAEYVVMERKEELKTAKEEFDGCVTKLRKLAAQVVADANRPLFNQVKVVQQTLPVTEATDVSPNAGDQSFPAKPGATLPPVDPSTLWRANSIDVLGLPPKMAEKLRCGDIATLGELADLIQRCEHGNHWPEGIGKGKGAKIVDALIAWQKENLETASQEVPVTIPAWDSLSVEEQGSYIESRAKRLDKFTANELCSQYADTNLAAIYSSGINDESDGLLLINCPYSPTPEGDWSRVDAWVAGWAYNNRRLDSNDPVCGTEE